MCKLKDTIIPYWKVINAICIVLQSIWILKSPIGKIRKFVCLHFTNVLDVVPLSFITKINCLSSIIIFFHLSLQVRQFLHFKILFCKYLEFLLNLNNRKTALGGETAVALSVPLKGNQAVLVGRPFHILHFLRCLMMVWLRH